MKLTFQEVVEKIKPAPEHNNFKDRSGQQHHELFIMFYVGKSKCSDSKYACRCSCGNYTIVSSGNMRPNNHKAIVSCGCVRLKKNKTISDDDIKNRVERVHSETPYKVLDHANGGVDRQKWTFNCSLHGEFKSFWNDIVISRKKCSGCARLGGFDQTQPGYFYLHELYDGDNLAGLKYGITNKDVYKRMKQLQGKSFYKIVNIYSMYFKRGYDASQLENTFSSLFGSRYVSQDNLKIGFTETISPLKRLQAITYLNALSLQN